MNELKIGWAQRDVSTDKPINIPGQFPMRISRGVHDPVTTTALVLNDGGDVAIFLSLDAVVIRSGLYDLVVAKTKARNPEIPSEKILMNVTHAHTGPSHYRDEKFEEDGSKNNYSVKTIAHVPHDGMEIASSDEYREFLSDQCADAVAEAWAKMAAGGVAWGYGYAVVAHSRRTIYFDDVSTRPGEGQSGYRVNGHGVMYGNTNDPNFSGYESGADHFVNLLYTFDARGNLTGAIINVPCPSQCSEHMYMLSADYWDDVRREVRRRFGEKLFILPQCAAAGDLSPRILHYKAAQVRRFRLKYGMETADDATVKAFAERKDIAERIADAFGEVLSWARKDIRTSAVIKHEVVDMQLTRRRITEDEVKFARDALAAQGEFVPKTDGSPEHNLTVNSSAISARNRFIRVLQRYEDQDKNPTMPMQSHIIRVGDIAFASNRFELYMDFMHRIQARSPFIQTFVVQLAGVPGEDGGSYLATTKGAENKGYSACLFCNQVSPEGGQELVENTLEVLKKLAD